MSPVKVIGPDKKEYQFPDGTTKDAAVRYFKSKGLSPGAQQASAPAAPAATQDPREFLTRVLDSISGSAQSTAESPRKLMERSRELFKEGRTQGGLSGNLKAAEAPFRAEMETILGMLKGIGGVTTPGMFGRVAGGEDPANIVGDAGVFLTGLMGGGEPAKGTLSTAVKPVARAMEKAGSGARILSQEISGAGKEPVIRAARSREAAIETSQAKHQGAVEQAVEHHREAVGKHARELAESSAKHVEQEAAAREKWVQKAFEHKQGKSEAAKVSARKETLERSTEASTKILKQNIDTAHEAVRNALGARWNALRDQVGKDTPLDSVKIGNAIEMAKQRFLMGSPESLKVFNDLMKQMEFEGDRIAAEGGGLQPALKPLTWDEGRVHHSALQDKIYSGELPGNILRGLRHVADTVDSQLKKVATEKGAGETYSKLKSDWSQYMDDWKDMSSVATGGSPLARALVAQDPGFVSSQVLGKAGERMMQIAARYNQYGLSPRLMSRIRGMNAELKSLPKVKVSAEPAPYEAPALPKGKEAPRIKEIAKPAVPAPVDPVGIRRARLEEFAGRPFRFYDLFPPYLIEHMMMKNPAFREWVATQKRQELKP